MICVAGHFKQEYSVFSEINKFVVIPLKTALSFPLYNSVPPLHFQGLCLHIK